MIKSKNIKTAYKICLDAKTLSRNSIVYTVDKINELFGPEQFYREKIIAQKYTKLRLVS